MTEPARCYDCGQPVTDAELVRRYTKVRIDTRLRVTLCPKCVAKRAEVEKTNRKYAVIVWLTILGTILLFVLIALVVKLLG